MLPHDEPSIHMVVTFAFKHCLFPELSAMGCHEYGLSDSSVPLNAANSALCPENAQRAISSFRIAPTPSTVSRTKYIP